MKASFTRDLKKKLENTFTIVCLGNSITCNGNEPTYTDFWQEMLEKKFGKGKFTIINSGVNGETAQDGYYRLEKDVITYNPHLVTIMFGHNEILGGTSAWDYARYLGLICHKLQKETPAKIWLLTPNKVHDPKEDRKYQLYLKALKDLAKEKRIEVIDVYKAFEDQDLNEIYTFRLEYGNLVGRDWVHPNQKGQKLIAQTLMEYFEEKVTKR